MIVWRSNLFLAALLLAVGAGGGRHRRRPRLAVHPAPGPADRAGRDLDGPPIEQVNGPANPRIDELAGEPAARRVPMDEATAQIEAFAASLDDAQKNEQLIKLFVRTLEIINNDRSSIIEGIKEYARGQRTLAQSINAKNERLIDLPKDQVLERDALVAERDWDVRIYDDRARSLTYLCEQPVLLDQRAFALARAIAEHLE